MPLCASRGGRRPSAPAAHVGEVLLHAARRETRRGGVAKRQRGQQLRRGQYGRGCGELRGGERGAVREGRRLLQAACESAPRQAQAEVRCRTRSAHHSHSGRSLPAWPRGRSIVGSARVCAALRRSWRRAVAGAVGAGSSAGLPAAGHTANARDGLPLSRFLGRDKGSSPPKGASQKW